MRFSRLSALILALLLVAPAIAQAPPHRDGNFWRTLSHTQKTMTVGGVFDGISIGYGLTILGMDDEKGGLSATKSFQSSFAKYLANVTAGQAVDGLDKIYEDYRNRTISITDGFYIVINSIAGAPDAEMKTMIENYRRSAK
jgi:hypothetical protein